MEMKQAEQDPMMALSVRVRRLERAIEGQALELRTQRLVVVDHQGAERIVGEVVGGSTAELRVDLPGQPAGECTSAVIFANPGDITAGLPSGVGMHLWVEGDAVRELDAWAEPEE